MEATIKGIPVYYEVIGSGTPVFMIHGWSVDHRLMSGCMEPVFADLSTEYQRIYFDLPGMGKTPSADWIDGSDRMLEVVLGLIDTLLPKQHFLLAGESFGGYLARGVIKARREWVDGLLLICPAVSEDTRLRNLPPFTVLEKDEGLLARLTEEELNYFTGINVIQNERVWLRFKEEVIPALKVADYAFLENTLSKHVMFKENVDIIEQPYPQPTLFLMGHQDNSVGYRDHWQLIENFPRATFAILDKAGHNLQIEADILFPALVKDWLDRVEYEQRSTTS
jgi:pimeloyl-ACP methyl ester carboxylesterase